jgi:hypothetical protein
MGRTKMMKKIIKITCFTIFTIAIGILCNGCEAEYTSPLEISSSSKIFDIKGCDMYYVDFIHENHEYLMNNKGGIIHKVNCKFCKGKSYESNNSN